MIPHNPHQINPIRPLHHTSNYQNLQSLRDKPLNLLHNEGLSGLKRSRVVERKRENEVAEDVVRSGLPGVVQELSRQVAVGLVVGREALGKELAGDAVQDAREGLLVWC